MSSGQAVSNLIVVVIVFFFAAFFVAAEFAIVSVRKSQIESMLEDGEGNKKKLEMALKMVDNMNEYLSTTQVGVSLTGIILGWLGADTLSQIFADFFSFTPLNHTTIMAISAVLGVVLLTYLEVVLTEIVPKNISIDMPMKVMMFVVRPLHYFHILFYPFVWLLNASANGIVKAMGLKPAGEDTDVLSENEILNLSKNAVTGGSIDKEDYLYMRRAFEFNDKVAKDVMIDRTSVEVVDITATVKDVLNKYLQEKHSRYPVVANNDKDKILGYVYIYDLIRQSRVDDTIKISKLLRTIISVPETTELQGLLRQMTRKRVPMVVVLDEYGGTSGIVTDRDIYEEVFGTVLDEADDVLPDDIIDNHNGTYKVSGKTTLYDFERYFGFQEKDFLESESVTLAGYLQDNYKIQLGTEVELGGLKVKVTEFNRNYVDWVEVREMKK
ncbi:hemolysin family protein [Ligilactobacillus sp. MP3]|uniref:hemolysin family protein n=1 Tax=Ligilactobacillus TaxID=2767887 RepID=UPI00210DDDB7|nr:MULTISPECIES: hemolysin family protein [Ligilactobacillus]MCQ4116776.1 hemolysin family protein [Ligilactobacillus sp. MP3]